MVLVDSATAYQPVVFRRGNPNRAGVEVPRRFLKVLSGKERSEFTGGSGRLELAQAITDPNNPLTARVIVNRIWQQHFATGLVATTSDFGLRSNPPSHPELLDWLAAKLVDGGWSIKDLHRTMMTSSVYRQSSTASSMTMERDPENRLLGRFPRRRLDYESIRDAQLVASGSLDPRRGGPPFDLESGYKTRRSIYGFINRMDLPGLLRTFDFPEPAATSPGRETTTVPQQALYFLNHDFVRETSRRLIRRSDIAAADDAAKISLIYQILFARTPTDQESRLAQTYLQASPRPVPATRWRYGYGSVDDDMGRTSEFTELTYWTGERIQGSDKLPDPQLGWVFHDASGGHPASSASRNYILRWISPIDGSITITGTLAHTPEPGNGVRGRIVSDSQGVLGEWKVDQSEAPTEVQAVVQPGTTIDFVVDWQGHITHDEFQWPIVIECENTAEKDKPSAQQRWSSVEEFRRQPSDPWVDYVHALLMTNEFVYLD